MVRILLECPEIGTKIALHRDGDERPWSTFFMNIGTPPQAVRLVPSISGSGILPILKSGCTPQLPASCQERRGSLFDPSSSSTWSELGLSKPDIAEDALGHGGNNASVGFDTATFGAMSNNQLITNPQVHQIIEGITTMEIFLGVIGISPYPINISSSEYANSSLLANLKNQSSIPSLSWGYTAGATYREDNGTLYTFASLTLGGYDSMRLIANNVTFPFGPEIGREFVAGMQSISSNASSFPLLSSNITVFLDSLDEDLWLPIEACDAMEKALGLMYNATANQYYINVTTIDSLFQQSPQISFELSPLDETAQSVSIELPIASMITTGNTTFDNFNPVAPVTLKRAQNATQYSLGRFFFQEAYIIADYERSTFSISQARFPYGGEGTNIVAILPPGEDDVSVGQKSSLSRAAIAGIAVGSTCFVLALAFVLFWRKRRRNARIQALALKEKRQDSSGTNRGFNKPELPGMGNARKGRTWVSELAENPGERSPAELTESGLKEIHSSHDGHEMPASASTAELPSPSFELEALAAIALSGCMG